MNSALQAFNRNKKSFIFRSYLFISKKCQNARPDLILFTKLGEYGIAPKKFSNDTPVKMSWYKNRMIHFYHEVTREELYQILQNDLGDLEKFRTYIKKLIQKPKKFDFETR